MGFKSLSIVLLGLALCCFLQTTAAQDNKCLLKFWFYLDHPEIWIYKNQEGRFTADFHADVPSAYFLLTFTKGVEKKSSYCDYCSLKVFSGKNFDGTSKVVDFRKSVGDNSLVSWNFNAYSYTLDCFPPEPEPEPEPEEEEIEVPEEEEEYFEEHIEEEEEEEEEDLSRVYADAAFQEMNEGDGSTLPYTLVETRHKAVLDAINRLLRKRVLPAGQYTAERVFATELDTNYDEDLYRFNVQLRDASGVEYRIWYVILSLSYDHQEYVLVDAGYKENRIAEFPKTDFKVLAPVDDSQQPYPDEVEQLRSKSLNQAVGRLQAREVLPQADYTIHDTFSIEYSAIGNMTEYPDHDDMLYRFNLRVIDESGVLFRVWAIIATNYETPEYYELIDFGYKESRLAEFANTNWREMNEEEDMPLPSEIVEMRRKSVAHAVRRFIAEGTLPEGQYTITKAFATEFSASLENPNIVITNVDILYRFNVQLSNEAGERFRVAVVVLTDAMIQPTYELIDYMTVENRFDEFTNIKFVSLDEGGLASKSINEAVEKLIANKVLAAGKYTITKTFPTQFSPKFEHPDYSSDEYILFNFTAQVNNAAGAGSKVYAVVIAKSDDLGDYELIDYGKADA